NSMPLPSAKPRLDAMPAPKPPPAGLWKRPKRARTTIPQVQTSQRTDVALGGNGEKRDADGVSDSRQGACHSTIRGDVNQDQYALRLKRRRALHGTLSRCAGRQTSARPAHS